MGAGLAVHREWRWMLCLLPSQPPARTPSSPPRRANSTRVDCATTQCTCQKDCPGALQGGRAGLPAHATARLRHPPCAQPPHQTWQASINSYQHPESTTSKPSLPLRRPGRHSVHHQRQALLHRLRPRRALHHGHPRVLRHTHRALHRGRLRGARIHLCSGCAAGAAAGQAGGRAEAGAALRRPQGCLSPRLLLCSAPLPHLLAPSRAPQATTG